MLPVEVFGVIVRTFGLLIALYGLWYALYAILHGTGITTASQTHKTRDFAVAAVFFILIGGAMLMRGDMIATAAYR